jgi:hypothetical protein
MPYSVPLSPPLFAGLLQPGHKGHPEHRPGCCPALFFNSPPLTIIPLYIILSSQLKASPKVRACLKTGFGLFLGIMGDPSAATREAGEKLIAAVLDELTEIIVAIAKSEGMKREEKH